MKQIVEYYESNIYPLKDSKDTVFESKYFDYYYEAIKHLSSYGTYSHKKSYKYFTSYCKNNGFEWGGWANGSRCVCGIYKQTLTKFMKKYKLTNPVSISKSLEKRWKEEKYGVDERYNTIRPTDGFIKANLRSKK